MSSIRSEGTKVEARMAAMLHETGLSYEKHAKILGKPDFLIDNRVAVFCDSDFWHGRNWRKLCAQLKVGSNPDYWTWRIARNRKRDKEVTAHLRSDGYGVVRLWETEINQRPGECIMKIQVALKRRRT